MKVLTLIRGLPGSGKSTLAGRLVSCAKHAIWFEADMWMTAEDGAYRFDPDKLPYAHAWCQQATEVAMKAGIHNVIVSNTFCGLWEVNAYIELAVLYGYTIQLLECSGEWGSIHDVPPEKMEAMRRRFATWQEMHEYIKLYSLGIPGA